MVVKTGSVSTFEDRQDVNPFTVSFDGFPINLTVQKIHEVTEIAPSFIHVDLLIPTSQSTDTSDPLFQRQGHSKWGRESLEIHEGQDGLTVGNSILVCSHKDVQNR
jgi:hypothetical protein